MAGQETYQPGQCTWYCAGEAWYVQGGWGNAGDWCGSAAASGLLLSGIPTQGSIVVYCPGGGYSRYGHCAYVEGIFGPNSFQVREMNYVAPFVVDHRVSNMSDVCCFILAPGTSPGQGGPPPGGKGEGDPGQAVIEWGLLQNWLNDRVEADLTTFSRVEGTFNAI